MPPTKHLVLLPDCPLIPSTPLSPLPRASYQAPCPALPLTCFPLFPPILPTLQQLLELLLAPQQRALHCLGATCTLTVQLLQGQRAAAAATQDQGGQEKTEGRHRVAEEDRGDGGGRGSSMRLGAAAGCLTAQQGGCLELLGAITGCARQGLAAEAQYTVCVPCPVQLAPSRGTSTQEHWYGAGWWWSLMTMLCSGPQDRQQLAVICSADVSQHRTLGPANPQG